MTIEEIMFNRERLDKDLLSALSTMERKDVILQIRKEIQENQNACPHFSEKYKFDFINDMCPYCGKKL